MEDIKLEDFIREWNDASEYVEVQTSGSTGTPKIIKAEKKKMVASAEMTCDFLGLKANDTALLCMSLKHIGAKMMVVRSIVRKLRLIEVPVSGHPLANLSCAPDFAAMVPLQVYNSLQNEEEKKILFQIKNLIIGGGAIDKKMEEELKDAPNNVWSTYGMTETLSHIALRKINGNNASEWYTPFKEVSLQLTDDQTLRIIAPTLCDTPLDTNDIAEINANGDFKIIGRKDNTVISGGVKIHVEEVERLLGLDADLSFAIGGLPNEKFGQILVALTTPEFENTLKSKIPLLPKYFQPKKIFLTEQIPTTENGKIDRKKLREILKENSMT
jgi:O-succinylbenzoic acid--CoA ligase